jgi:hypothetical protein
MTVHIDYIRILDDNNVVVVSWDFNTAGDTEGWFQLERYEIYNVQVSNGDLSFAYYAARNGYGFVEGPNLAAEESHSIEMRYRIDLPPSAFPFSQTASFLWHTKGSGDYVDGDIQFTLAVDSQYHVVSIPIGKEGRELDENFRPIGLGGWQGVIDRFRIDPGTGLHIVSPLSGDGAYVHLNGTSMAAPAVTGVVAIMFETFVKTQGIKLDINPPLPSTIKGILIQTATDLVHKVTDDRDSLNPDTGTAVLYYEGPDFATGYGLVNAPAAVNFVAEATTKSVESQLDHNQTEVYEINVAAGVPELKVTLVWDDVEADPAVGDQRLSRLRNNLDLVLRSPSGHWYYPWRLDPLPVATCGDSGPGCGAVDPIKPADIRPAYRGPDARNNVEQVQVNKPQMGKWQVFVFGFGVKVPKQSYSVVANLLLTKIEPGPPDRPKHGDFNGDDLVDHSDNLILYKHIANVPDYLLRDESFDIDKDNCVRPECSEINIADILFTEPQAYPFFIVNQFLRASILGAQTIQDSVGCPVSQNFVARYKFTARFINRLRSLHALVIRVQQLTNGNLLKNADIGAGGAGALMTVPKKDKYTDGILGPWFGSDVEFVDVPFEICLKGPVAPFSFFVDVLGVARE